MCLLLLLLPGRDLQVVECVCVEEMHDCNVAPRKSTSQDTVLRGILERNNSCPSNPMGPTIKWPSE
jgi:hypothetical protein